MQIKFYWHLLNDFTDERRHHEIYLSDPRKVAPEKCKTVVVNSIMHYLQTTGQNDIDVTVRTVIILVNLTTDNLNAFSFLRSGKYAVTGTSCCYEQDI